ncbi:MAG: thiosulfate reductase [Deltaproteobacteria bacterium]|nr:MAG: thiosulfate reductase [Deltaproteobacteria bacterium]
MVAREGGAVPEETALPATGEDRRPEHWRPRAEQPLAIRLTHWINVPVLLVMAMSGLQILAAFPRLGPKGAPYGWYLFDGKRPPAWMTTGEWLAGARHIHFGLGWFLVANGLVYLAYAIGSGEWRRRAFLPGRDARNAMEMALYYARIRRTAPKQDLYNGLQRLAYTSAIALGVIEVLSGFAIWKPVQLSLLAALFGGYDGARAVHLLGLVALALFTVGHIVLVALHPRELASIFTGGKRR